jgi:dephospho-CoA kinase
VILDIPLLFESKFSLRLLSYKIVVYCDETQQLDRLLKRNRELSIEDARNRINSQMKIDEKLKRADFIIDNSKSIENTENQVVALNEKLNKSKEYLKIRFILLSFAFLLTSGLIYALNKIF